MEGNQGPIMDLSDEVRIEASREAVYAALNDPEVLKRCIPGCESLERLSESELEGTVQVKVGPVRAKFKGKVTLSDFDPPAGYTLTGEGKGGAAGIAKGSAKVRLTEDGGATLLRYDVTADVGGKLAQLGGRLIESTSKKLAGQFFSSLEAAMADTAPDADERGAAEPDISSPAPETDSLAAGERTWLGVGIAAAFLLVILAWVLGR